MVTKMKTSSRKSFTTYKTPLPTVRARFCNSSWKQDNEINKEIVFQTNLIDTFANLVTGHRKNVKNFQVFGASVLEASSKIYGYSYRVDVEHKEVIRMYGGLWWNEGGIEKNDPITEGSNNVQDPKATAKAKAKKRRQQSSFVPKCKATINGKLDTVSFLDPVFVDIKSNLVNE